MNLLCRNGRRTPAAAVAAFYCMMLSGAITSILPPAIALLARSEMASHGLGGTLQSFRGETRIVQRQAAPTANSIGILDPVDLRRVSAPEAPRLPGWKHLLMEMRRLTAASSAGGALSLLLTQIKHMAAVNGRLGRVVGDRHLHQFEEERADDALKANRCPQRSVKDKLFRAIEMFDSSVCDTTKEVLVKDREKIQVLAELMRKWVSHPFWVDQLGLDVRVDEQPNVMCRVHLYIGQGIEVRLHLIKDPSETLIHNHGTNFYSST